MMPPRWNRRRVVQLLIAVPAVPAVLWGLVLLVAPTDWARARLVAELEAVTGRKVAIGSIQIGLLGHMKVGGIAVAEAATPDDPWLTAREARLDVHVLQMLSGCCKASGIDVDGLDLRIHRGPDGTLEFAGIFDSDPKAATAAGTASPARSRADLTLTLRGARVVLIDDPSATRVELSEAEGKATWDGSLLAVESVRGRLNGGTLDLAGRFDRASTSGAFAIEARARGVALGVGMKSLGFLVPVVSDVADSLDGKLDLSLALKGEGTSLETIRSGLKGHGAVRLDPIDLSGSKILDTIDGFHQVPRVSRVGSVDSHFAIADGRVATDDLTLRVARLPITLAGWTDFDGRIDYRVKSEALRDKLAGRLPDEARQILGELRDDLGDLARLRITGTVDAPRIAGGSDGAGRGVPSRGEEKVRLQNAAKKLRDRLLR